MPVLGHLGKAKGAAEVHQVEDVLLEARPAKADGRLEKLGADARVDPDGVGDLGDIGTRHLAESGDRVDGRDPLGEEGVGCELGKLSTPEVGREDALGRDPAPVDIRQALHGRVALRRDGPAHKDAVWLEEIVNRRALRQELRVGEDLEVGADAGSLHDARHRIGRLDGDGRLLHNDLGHLVLGLVAYGGNPPRGKLPVRQVSRLAGADAGGLGGGVDGDKDDRALPDRRIDVGREEEVASAGLLDDLLQARLVDRQVVRIPSGDAALVEIAHSDLDIRAHLRDHRHRRAANIARAQAADLRRVGIFEY
mmetsp:Transcript_2494/g.5441  ORF Transcript_2494/g.5441 Transcript_2494/m.5441 type:complete len:309 (+) Transcript_2494:1053-1979(+)